MRKKKESKISEETKLLMKKRREMKEENNHIKRIEYIELNKTVRKKMREDIRRYNEKLVRNTIEENRSLKKPKQLMIGKKQIIAVKRPDGTVSRNKEEIIKIFENFCRELYYSEEELRE